jgi:hypothetical protein
VSRDSLRVVDIVNAPRLLVLPEKNKESGRPRLQNKVALVEGVTENAISRWRRRRVLIFSPSKSVPAHSASPTRHRTKGRQDDSRPANAQCRSSAAEVEGKVPGRTAEAAATQFLHDLRRLAVAVACGFPASGSDREPGGGKLWSELSHYVRTWLRIGLGLAMRQDGDYVLAPALVPFSSSFHLLPVSNRHLFFSLYFSVVQCTETHDTRRACLSRSLPAHV